MLLPIHTSGTIELIAEAAGEHASVESTPIQLTDGEAILQAEVIAENGDVKTYIVHFTSAKDDNTALKELHYQLGDGAIVPVTLEEGATEQQITLPKNSSGEIQIDAEAVCAEAEVRVEPVTLIDGKATAVITVIAEDGSEQVYRIYFVSETEVPQEPVDPTPPEEKNRTCHRKHRSRIRKRMTRKIQNKMFLTAAAAAGALFTAMTITSGGALLVLKKKKENSPDRIIFRKTVKSISGELHR